MEALYRACMIRWREEEPNKNLVPEVCLECAGWAHFGGRCAEDVTVGPMCICDHVWERVKVEINKKTVKRLIKT